MPTEPTTIVAWDPSATSAAALEWALRREQIRHGSIELVTVLDDVRLGPGLVVSDQMTANAQAAVTAAAKRAHDAHPDIPVRGRVVHGFIINALARETAPARLLVIGTHDRRGPHFRYGWSFGARVAALAHGPVAIIPTTVPTTGSGIVVGVDGSETARVAVRFAAAEARHTGQKLRLVHAWQEPSIYESTYLLDEDFVTAIENEHRQTLQHAADDVHREYPDVATDNELTLTLSRGDAARALLQAEPAPALVVVGSRGLHGLPRLLLGSVSHDVVLNLDVPVIVVGPAALTADVQVQDVPTLENATL